MYVSVRTGKASQIPAQLILIEFNAAIKQSVSTVISLFSAKKCQQKRVRATLANARIRQYSNIHFFSL